MFRFVRLVILSVLWGAAVYGESRMDTVSMPTLSAKNNRPVVFYLPDGYDEDGEGMDSVRYPVLYLLHGINGDEYSWMRHGNIKHIMDSLISNRIVRPCVVVMPNTNAGEYIWGKRYKGSEDNRDLKKKGMMRSLFGYFKNRKGNFLTYFDEIEELTYSHYKVSEEPQDRIVAGLSNGALQAAMIANMHPGRYVWVGLLSPVIFDGQAPQYEEDWCVTDDLPEGTHFFISVGKADIFRSYGVSYSELLRERHIPYVLINGRGGHDWNVWRSDFTTFMRYAFPYERTDRKHITDS